MKETKEIKLKDILSDPLSLKKESTCCFKATIERIENYDQPWYNACKACSKKINVTEYGTDCTRCKDKNVEHIPRLFLRLEVVEGNDKLMVVLFEEVATILIGCLGQEYIESISKGKERSRFYRAMCLCKLKEYKFLIITNNTTAEDASKGSVVVRAIKPVQDKEPILIDDSEIIGTYSKKKRKSEKDGGNNKNVANKKIKKRKIIQQS